VNARGFEARVHRRFAHERIATAQASRLNSDSARRENKHAATFANGEAVIAMSLPFVRVAWRVTAIIIAVGIVATMIATGGRH
jgi:hypothetical protein